MLTPIMMLTTVHALPSLHISTATIVAESCQPPNGVPDPYEYITINLVLINMGSDPTTNLTATLLPGSGVYFPSGPRSFGAIAPSASSLAAPFSLTVTGGCGGLITASWSLSDNGTPLGIVSRTFTIGTPTEITNSFTQPERILFDENFAVVANPYPSAIEVSGITNPVNRITVSLNDTIHTWASDLDVLVSGPSGQSVLLMAGAGADADIFHAGITFDELAVDWLPEWDPITTGSYRPTAFRNYPLPAPAPPQTGGAYSLEMSNLLNGSLNGTWSLWVNDTYPFDGGSMDAGWTVNFFSPGAGCLECGNTDLDNDGFTTADEVRAGTNPTSANSWLHIDRITDVGSNIVVSFPSVSGRTYSVERTTLPNVTNWVTIANGLSGNDASLSVTDTNALNLNRCIYRVRLTTP